MYPESCFSDLIGVRGVCEPKAGAKYWLDDLPGFSLQKLAKLAEDNQLTGENFARNIISAASRIMSADVEAIYDASYKVESMLVQGCSACTFKGNYLNGNQLGVTVKNNTSSAFSVLVIDKLTMKLNSTGLFTVVIDDGVAPRSIPIEFEAGVVIDGENLNYRTKQKKVRIYIAESDALLAQVSCPNNSSGCGCSGKTKHVVTDLIYTGTAGGNEQQQAYGFQPCAFVTCDPSDLLCFVAKSAPNMVGLALLYKAGEIYFNHNMLATRNNRIAGLDNEEKERENNKYTKLYTDKLVGKGTRGVKDIVFSTLQNSTDVCVVCNSLNSTAWAIT